MNCKNCNKEIISKFKVGDVVSHKTNGAKLVITSVVDDKSYHPRPLPGYQCRFQKTDGYFMEEYFQEFEVEIKK